MRTCLGLFVILIEVLLITALNYAIADTHISLDVLYCLPIIQATRIKALQSKRSSDSYFPVLLGVFVAVAWSLTEVQVYSDEFTLEVLALNIFTRSLIFSILGRVLMRLWKEREYGHKDFLTNLSNRSDFLEQFSQEQFRSERSNRPYSLLFIDIDHFKQLNDKKGHQVGDIALHTVSEILRASSRKVDTIARIGGDEFVLLFPETNVHGAELLKQRIIEASATEFSRNGWEISLSIGAITHTGSDKSAVALLSEADGVMYAIKKAKRLTAST